MRHNSGAWRIQCNIHKEKTSYAIRGFANQNLRPLQNSEVSDCLPINVARIENENQLTDAQRLAHLPTPVTLSPGGRTARFNFLTAVIGRVIVSVAEFSVFFVIGYIGLRFGLLRTLAIGLSLWLTHCNSGFTYRME